jgi:hypothetical protein
LYLVEINSRKRSKERGKKHIQTLLEEILHEVKDMTLREKIISQIQKY